ncbi:MULTISPECIES: phage tail protein [Burkholderia cepacia complex]|uniref:phage tail protein n=1 Tax=Burkholderia cepacia complex TaxID=87882 RepID=UPI001AA0AE06|nr:MULTISPECIES: phage tail protein [Burkholderia cepacia complex]QTD88732.1 phage tail protein [Burkholderia anthina]
MLNDLNHYFGNDLVVSSAGDLSLSSGGLRGQQRVLRRLLTNPALKDATGKVIAPADYIFHPDYGAGVRRMVGTTASLDAIRAVILSQMLLEDAVARTPPPDVDVSAIAGGVSVTIQYADANGGGNVVLAFDVTN